MLNDTYKQNRLSEGSQERVGINEYQEGAPWGALLLDTCRRMLMRL